MTYFITEIDSINGLLDNLEHRERELAGYDANIVIFAHIIANNSDIEFVKEMTERIGQERKMRARAQAAHDAVLAQLDGENIPALIAKRPKKM